MEFAVVVTLVNLLIFGLSGLTYMACKRESAAIRHTFQELKETLSAYRRTNSKSSKPSTR